MSKINFQILDYYNFPSALSRIEENFLKIGKGSMLGKAVGGQVVFISNPMQAIEYFGNSALTKSIHLHFALGGKAIFAVMPKNSIAGSFSAIESFTFNNPELPKKGSAWLRLGAEAVPVEDQEIQIHFLKGGGLKSAYYRVSIDGGKSWSAAALLIRKKIVLSNSLALHVENTPVKGKGKGESTPFFVEGDVFQFSVKGDSFNEEDFFEALAEVPKIPNLRWVQILDSSLLNSTELVLRLNEWILEARNNKVWLRVLIQYPQRSNEQSFESYKENILLWLRSFYSSFLVVTFQYGFSSFLNQWVQVADYLLLTISRSKVYESPGWVLKFPQKDVLKIYDEDLLLPYLKEFEEEGVSYMYFEKGPFYSKYPFFNLGLLKNPPHVNFRTISMGRIMDKAMANIYSVVFPFLRSSEYNFDYQKSGKLALRSSIENILDRMIQRGEIEAYTLNFTSPPGKPYIIQTSFQIRPVSHFESFDFNVSLLPFSSVS